MTVSGTGKGLYKGLEVRDDTVSVQGTESHIV